MGNMFTVTHVALAVIEMIISLNILKITCFDTIDYRNPTFYNETQ